MPSMPRGLRPPTMTSTWTYNPQPPRPHWGIHAPTHKAAATRQPIVEAAPPAEATLSLLQGAGGPATALVRPGDRVQTGQPVARHVCGTLIHASISGLVSAIETRPVPAASPTLACCIVIRQQGPEQWHASCEPRDPAQLSPGEIRHHIARGGIVGLGGALFPTATKLAAGVPIRALIINGAECEPWISCDEMLLRERADSVIEGARIMMRALDTGHAVIAVESDMPEARIALTNALGANPATDIGIAVVTAKYPAGGERQLIELITGEQVPAHGLPRDIGYVCQNAGTAAAVAAWFRQGRPLISRIVTVTGSGVAAPGNFEVRIGTPIRTLIDLAGGHAEPPQRLLMGGPMMGVALTDDTLGITKASNCIVAATARDCAPATVERPCIRCGDCVEVCPARLLPHELFHAVRRGDARQLAELGLDACIECGCCDYVCPSHITLSARFAAEKAARHPAPGTA